MKEKIEQFQRTKFFNVIETIHQQMMQAQVSTHAAAMTYFIILSIFPALLVLANLVILLPSSLIDVLQENITLLMPEDIYNMLEPIYYAYIRSTSSQALSAGLLIGIWLASRMFTSLQTALNSVYGTVPRHNFIVVRIFSLVIAVMLIILMATAAFLFVFGQQLIRLIEQVLQLDLTSILNSYDTARWGGFMLIAFSIMAVVYFFVPNVKWQFRYALPGALLATAGFTAISQLFSTYVSFVSERVTGNGTLGIVIVFMIWLYMFCTVLLLGGVCNTIVHHYFYPHDRDEINNENGAMKQNEKNFRIR